MWRARDYSERYPLEGHRVGRLWLDQGFALELHPPLSAEGDFAVLRLFLRFSVERSGHRTSYEAHDHAALAPLFSLLRSEVVAAERTADLGFRLELSGGWRLMAESLHEMDYWELLYPCRPPAVLWAVIA